ncbi:MAG: hypothetical protein WB438_04235 [Candidatus Cybelea sp.]
MPRSCSVCLHPEGAAITKAIGSGVSLRDIAARYGFPHHAAVQRHKSKCMGIAPQARRAAPVKQPEAVQSARINPSDPTALLAAQAALVDQALDVAEHAADHKTQLAAIREARDGLVVLMKNAGMFSDGVNVNVALRQSDVLSKLSIDELRALARGKPFDGSIDSKATQGSRAALAAGVDT